MNWRELRRQQRLPSTKANNLFVGMETRLKATGQRAVIADLHWNGDQWATVLVGRTMNQEITVRVTEIEPFSHE